LDSQEQEKDQIMVYPFYRISSAPHPTMADVCIARAYPRAMTVARCTGYRGSTSIDQLAVTPGTQRSRSGDLLQCVKILRARQESRRNLLKNRLHGTVDLTCAGLGSGIWMFSPCSSSNVDKRVQTYNVRPKSMTAKLRCYVNETV
jgi:hypothetical protein